ncbi:MAG: hypothetical protein ACSHXY_10205 [Alphaproteobacteria bacterium]
MRYFMSACLFAALALPLTASAGEIIRPSTAHSVSQESGVTIYRGRRTGPSPQVIAAQSRLAQRQAHIKAVHAARARLAAAQEKSLKDQAARQEAEQAKHVTPKLRGRYGRRYYGNNRFFGPNGFAGNSHFSGASPRTNRAPRRRKY